MTPGGALALWAEIDLDALTHNLQVLRRRIGQGPAIMAVVKANAYGHGAVPVARALLEAGASQVGVARVDEGVQLRRAGIEAPVVVLGYVPPWEADEAVMNHLALSVSSRETALALSQAAREQDLHAQVHLKVDTGMGRLGLFPSEVPEFLRFLLSLPRLEFLAVYTHFASADEADKSYTREQFASFLDVVRCIQQYLPAGHPQVLRHAASSAAVIDLPEMALDMVRPGIALYGCYPSGDVSRSVDLHPVLSLRSRVVRLFDLDPGRPVSYGRTWTASRRSRLALVPCGYADGVPRLLSNRGSVLVRGRRAPIAGRVSMDQLVVDVTDIHEVELHDEVVLIGSQGEEQIPVEEVADLANTMNYEILSGISARVPRYYVQGGQVVSWSTVVEPAK